MAEIFVVRAMTVSGINTELYYRKKAIADAAFDALKKRMAELEKKKEGESAPVAWVIELTDDFGIRVALDLRGMPILVQTSITASAKTQSEVASANREAQDKFGQAVNAGYKPSSELVMAGAPGRR